MAQYRNQFEVITPGLGALPRLPAYLASEALYKAPATALKGGELVQFNADGTVRRADNVAHLAYHVISDYGDTGVQASRKVDLIAAGSYICNTLIFNPTGLVQGAPLMMLASIDIGDSRGAIHSGVGLHDGVSTKPVVGYVHKLPANNGGTLLQIHRVGL